MSESHQGRPRLPLLHRIAIGLALGVFVGVFLGERAAVFQFAADGFVKLLQMAVLPYMTVSVIATIGGLSADRLRPLGAGLATALALVWMIALLFAFLLPLTFPASHSGSFFSTTLVERRAPLDLIGLYIPANPFFALANNIVPAIVLFSIAVGAALIGLPRKQILIDALTTSSEALARVMRFVTGLTPYGVFAIAAHTAGTLRLEDASRLQIYLIGYAGLSFLVALWVLPGLVSALTPIPARAIFTATREALLTATIAGDLFIVLPLLVSASQDLISEHAGADAEGRAIPEAIVPIAYNFPHSGKVLTVSFILFAGWYSDVSIDPGQYPRLAAMSLFTFFGSMTAAVPFLLDVFRVPADTFQLYLATGVINARLGSMVAAMHTVAVALLGTCALIGAVRIRPRALLQYLAVTAVLTTVVIGGTRLMARSLVSEPEINVLDRMHVETLTTAIVQRESVEAPRPDGKRLTSISKAQKLRVGYLGDSLPFAYFNASDALVGLDVALMHHLAHELGVQLEFVPVARIGLDQVPGAAELLRSGYCDIIIGGIAITTERAQRMQLSNSYLQETLGFVVRDDRRAEFESWSSIRAQRRLMVAVPAVPYFVDVVRRRLPDAHLVQVTTTEAVFGADAREVGAIMMPAERGSAWTLRYPQYTVVVPAPDTIKVPLTYALPEGEPEFKGLVDTWIDLKRNDGTIQRLYEYWILGRDTSVPPPRWSIIRDVLHLVE